MIAVTTMTATTATTIPTQIIAAVSANVQRVSDCWVSRRQHDALCGSELCLRGIQTIYPSIEQPRILSIRLYAQKLRIHQRVEHGFAEYSLHAAEALHLLEGKPRAGHSEILGANTCEDILNGSHRDLMRLQSWWWNSPAVQIGISA